MNAGELFPRLAPEIVDTIFGNLFEEDKAGYRSVVQTLAIRRKLRPQYLERKQRLDRHVWMAEDLGRGINADMAAQVLQSWLLLRHRDMIRAFLDSLSIPHDGEGMLETLPPQPDKEQLQNAIEELFKTYSPDAVAIYLHIFNAMDIAEWSHLEELLTSDLRLTFLPTVTSP